MHIVFYPLAYDNPNLPGSLSKIVYKANAGIGKAITNLICKNPKTLSDYINSIEDFNDIDTDKIIDSINSFDRDSEELSVALV